MPPLRPLKVSIRRMALIAENLLRWFRARRIRRMGSSTLKALRDLDAGGHWVLVGRRGEHAAGNGAAMRIAPLAFCTDPSTSLGRQMIRGVCRITHHSEEAYVGALAVVLSIHSPLGLGDEQLLQKLKICSGNRGSLRKS